MLVYFSSTSEYTKRFVEKTGIEGVRIPIKWDSDNPLLVTEPYILVVPSYGAGRSKDAIPKQVIKFLNIKENRDNAIGVIGSGNTNYGVKYCLGAKKVAEKLNIPMLYTYEMFGTPQDIEETINIHERYINGD